VSKQKGIKQIHSQTSRLKKIELQAHQKHDHVMLISVLLRFEKQKRAIGVLSVYMTPAVDLEKQAAFFRIAEFRGGC
jgi:hypothetical protein